MQLSAPQPSQWKKAFFLALLAAALVFLPFVLYERGYFIYYGDFNVQQIPFYKLAHQAVRSGDFFWNWHTDLGVNFIGSYSFYLLFSPFFWLTLPFPTEVVPHLMAPLLILKTACASLTAYLYLERFVRDKQYAVIAGLLYAFSGWMDFNIFFNHFHEVAVFFPLLLLSLELLVTENRRGFFAVMVALNAVVNYWFFVGEAVFVVLYVLVRMRDKSWGMTPRRFAALSFEAVLGALLAMAVLLPSVMALMGNPRTTAAKLINGWRIWLYYHVERQPAIVQAMFFPPELPSRPNFLPNHGAKWASLSAWLPLFGMTGVLSYFFARKRDWLKNILGISFLFAMVPVLNSLFILFNNSYYARWYYMPLLLMALATVRALEDAQWDDSHFRRGLKWTGIVLLAFTVMAGLTPKVENGELLFGLADNPDTMWLFAGVAFACLLLTGLVIWMRRSPAYCRMALAGVMAVAVCFTTLYIYNGKNDRDRGWLYQLGCIENSGIVQAEMPDGPFARTDFYSGAENQGMFWGLPTIQAFHSIVPASIMDFYPTVGVTRDVGSRPETDYYALRPLLSVRWLIIRNNVVKQSPMEGYDYVKQIILYNPHGEEYIDGFYDDEGKRVSHTYREGEPIAYNLYENQNYLPMGFGYDYAITRDQLESLETEVRGNMLLRAVVLEEDAIRRNGDILRHMDAVDNQVLDYPAMVRDVENRRVYTADAFVRDNHGFTALTSFQKETLLFFSVPHEMGWSASVTTEDGQVLPLRIEKANIGFMAVRVPVGNCTVRFDYETPGLFTGLVCSGCALLILAGYLIGWGALRKKAPPSPAPQAALSQGEPVTMSWRDYRKQYGDSAERHRKLQQAIDSAAARQPLDPRDRTFDFHPGGAVDGEPIQGGGAQGPWPGVQGLERKSPWDSGEADAALGGNLPPGGMNPPSADDTDEEDHHRPDS